MKAPAGANGHAWKPEWLETFSWLRTEPSWSKKEWVETPGEGPDYIFCCCCVEFPSIGHKDVLQKKRSARSFAVTG